MKKLKCKLNECTLVHFGHLSCEIWTLIIKGITVHFFLLHRQKWIIEISLVIFFFFFLKKEETQLSCCPKVFYHWVPLLFFPVWGDSSRSSLLKFLRFSRSSSTGAALAGLRPSFVQIPDEGGSNRMDLMYHLPLSKNWVLLARCTQVSTPGQGETRGHCSEVKQPRSYEQLIGQWEQIFLYELSVEFSLLVEVEDWGVDEEEEEEEDVDVKFIPDKSGGFVAVFCPLKLFLHTGQVSCCIEREKKRLSVYLLIPLPHSFRKQLLNI